VTESPQPPPEDTPTVSQSLQGWFGSKLGGLVAPLAAAFLAFLVGAVLILAAGHNPFSAYKAIFDGTGLNPFSYFGDGFDGAWTDLQQTLIIFTPLVCTAIAVAFAFRCGMFNIGGQGQYLVGIYASLFIGTRMAGLPSGLHIVLAIVAAILVGALWGGIAGLLKASVGAHEVITTIMLNWIAIYGGQWLFELGGPLQGSEKSIPKSDAVLEAVRLPTFGTGLQPIHIGVFIAIASLFVYAILLNRTTLGFEVRAVGFNPEAARYSGISVGRNYFLALAIAGGFAGLGGALDNLGWKFTLATNDIQVSAVGFIGIAVALLGRNTAVGIFFSALLFAALQTGTSSRQIDASIFPPELAGNLSTMIQALIILFVATELLIVYIWAARKKIGISGIKALRQGEN
jgi:general nucleoside transport system permease protein